MTAETDLLPLPDVKLDGFTTHDMADYARANLAELQREVATWKGLHASEVQVRQRWQAGAEALRAEVAELRTKASEHRDGRLAALERAERLAGALRGMMAEYEALHARHDLGECQATVDARAALDQETTNG